MNRGINTVKRPAIVEVSVFLGLVVAGVVVRLAFQEIPNFAPVAALALFAGYYFTSRWTAAALPLLVMAITDTVIGGYHPGMMAVVYSALAAPVLFRGVLRRRLALGGPNGPAGRAAAMATAGLVTCSLGASVFFFVVTNFAHWAIYDMYEKSAAGLLHCAAAALPFFRYTLAGDLAFACVLFGGYALSMNLVRDPVHATE